MRCMVQTLVSNKVSITAAEYVWGVVGGLLVVYGTIHPGQALLMRHMTLIKRNIAYPYMYHYPWTTIPVMRSLVQALG